MLSEATLNDLSVSPNLLTPLKSLGLLECAESTERGSS